MKKHLLLDRSYDLYLSMTWSIGRKSTHGISGHIYEIIEYYLLLRDHFKVGILICEDFSWDTFKACIIQKYDVTDEILYEMEGNLTHGSQPKFVIGKNILFVDGGLKRCFEGSGVLLSFNNVLSFRCGKVDTHYDLMDKNVLRFCKKLTLLQDNRVYNDGDNDIAINYKKRMKFDAYKKVASTKTNTALIYMTRNCRMLADGDLIEVVTTYSNFDKYMILTSNPEDYRGRFTKHNLEFPDMPVENLFEKFDTYIYTPTFSVNKSETGCFDCSPRFIAECRHYGKQTIYHNIDDNYLNIDTGLKYRRYDVENNFDSVNLKSDDEIIGIIKSVI